MYGFFNRKRAARSVYGKNKSISEVMLVREIAKFGVGREAVWDRMRKSLAVMREGVGRSQTEQMNLLGGYIGGESKALLDRIRREGAMGGMISRASAYAMGVIELNASMGRIVAAPTAGSAGVLPGILVAADEIYDFGEERLTQALFNAGAVGYLIDRNATLSGAEGGCQAEVGAASAMAASALCELFDARRRSVLLRRVTRFPIFSDWSAIRSAVLSNPPARREMPWVWPTP